VLVETLNPAQSINQSGNTVDVKHDLRYVGHDWKKSLYDTIRYDRRV